MANTIRVLDNMKSRYSAVRKEFSWSRSSSMESGARSNRPTDTPLLYVLRNELELSGPQFGCGLAQCGACSVLLDGKEIRSCVTPLSAASGKEVTTLEGLPARWAQQKGLSPGRCREDAAPGSSKPGSRSRRLCAASARTA